MANQQISIDNSYTPFNLANLQGYNPIYSRFFDMNNDNYNMIALNHKCQVADLHTLFDATGKKVKKDVFVKFSPLLDPLKFIMGKYNLKDANTVALPSLDPSSCSSKIGNPNNCSYTDAFFSYLSNMLYEKHGFVHGVPFYGSALAIQNRFRFNLADDLDFVKDSEFFMNNIGKYYTLDENAELLLHDFSGSGSRSNRQKISIVDADPVSIDVDEIVDNNTDVSAATEEVLLTYEKTVEHASNASSKSESIHESESEDSGGSSCSDETEDEDADEKNDGEDGDFNDAIENEDDSNNSGSDWETETTEYEKEEPVYCYLHNFPVQMIFQERCAGTLDDLIMQRMIGKDEMIAALFQIIMILLTYQKAYDFTHNDLHTNNIMYVSTNQTHINYCFENTWYTVPTHGRIYKLIDFGRAIYRFQDKTFCSDSFAPNGDAYSQYNCEPFLNESKPRLDPNFSFDLCRLGCSMYDFFADDYDDANASDDPLDALIKKWCSDDENKNVVYKKNGQERYAGFKLYKMIARTVHAHTPKNQLTSPVFASFINHGKTLPKDQIVINIDEIPKYKNK